jgi:hypothetical protein
MVDEQSEDSPVEPNPAGGSPQAGGNAARGIDEGRESKGGGIELERVLASVPDAAPVEDLDAAIEDSVRYLGSDAALRSLEADIKWPKWHSPWWHMWLLWELGLAERIPDRVVAALINGLDALPIKILPIHHEDVPSEEMWRLTTCHCALGGTFQVLAACGVDVDARLPWIKPWFVRYQMADGGLNCHGDAYRVTDECPSSMIGTIAAFEAMLSGAWSPAQQAFLDRGAGFLIDRRLMRGSPTVHNAEERGDEASWLAPGFPRLYFYDVLRGLTALARWAERSGRQVPRDAIEGAVAHLVAAFPDGVIRRRRVTFAAHRTRQQQADGSWVRGEPATWFPLLEAASQIGAPSAVLTREWSVTRRRLIDLGTAGQIVD